MKYLGFPLFSLLIVSTSATGIADPTPTPAPTPVHESWVGPTGGQTEPPNDSLLLKGGQPLPENSDDAARLLSKMSPAFAAELARRGYTSSIKNQAEMEASLEKAGFTRSKAKPVARGVKSVTGKTWVKGGLLAVTVYESYLQLGEIIHSADAGTIPISSHHNTVPAFRWRLGGAILAAIVFGLYWFARRKGVLR